MSPVLDVSRCEVSVVLLTFQNNIVQFPDGNV